MARATLGVWVSHGEGKFNFPMGEENCNIVAKYGYDSHPAYLNISDYNTVMLFGTISRHLVMIPHIKRFTYHWN